MLTFLLALLPMLIILLLMLQFRWGAAAAGAVGWLAALLVAMLFFGAGPSLIAYSQLRAVFMTFYVLYLIWMALILYHTVNEAGVISAIGRQFLRLTGDRVLQLLLLGWVFSSFLQGASGYGVPIAVVAPLLIGLGFAPATSVIAVAIGHAWSVTFGSMAASFNALIAASGLPGSALAPWAALLLGLSCFACAICMVYAHGGWPALRHGLPAIALIGSVMAGGQYLLAVNGLWNISAFLASLAGLGAAVATARLPLYRTAQPAAPPAASPTPAMRPALAFAPYVVLVAIIIVAELVTPVHTILNSVKLQADVPTTVTALGWITRAGKTQAISLFGHAGALLLYASIIAYALLRVAGRLKPPALPIILRKTAKSAVKSSIGIAAMIGFALIMDQSGMTNAIASALSRSLAPAYAFVSPFIGLLGAFMTGTNTNSNVVFTGLQAQTARLLGLSLPVILGAQTAGGSLGTMVAPARIVVGCSTAGLAGKEGQVLRRTVGYGLLITVLVGLVTWIAARLVR